MPEIGEVTLFSKIINDCGKNFSFNSIKKFSAKNPDIPVKWKEFGIRSESRGKELAIVLYKLEEEVKKEIRILFSLSMTGDWFSY